MRFIRVGVPNEEEPGLLVNDREYLDVSSLTADIDGEFLLTLTTTGFDVSLLGSLPRYSLEGVRIGAPILRPGKIICVGLNYADHAAESGMDVPTEPVIFFKSPNTLVGPYDNVNIPRGSTKTDWEVELGVVLGQTCRYLKSPEDALNRIAGYVICHDVSEREFQLERGGQWVKGKSCETFNPCGPWLVTPDEIMDVNNLSLRLSVNGVLRQNGSTSTMMFGVAHLIWYLSQFMVLDPGDLINTGTPPGVAMGMAEPEYLRAGDTVELAIDGLGMQRQEFLEAL